MHIFCCKNDDVISRRAKVDVDVYLIRHLQRDGHDVDMNLMCGWESLRDLFEISNYWLTLALNLYRNKSTWARVRDRCGLWFHAFTQKILQPYWWPKSLTSGTLREPFVHLVCCPVSMSRYSKECFFFIILKMLDFNIFLRVGGDQILEKGLQGTKNQVK